jgi:di/tricarboxylate transporter
MDKVYKKIPGETEIYLYSIHGFPQTMAITVALGCSLGFPTPLDRPVNIMVMNFVEDPFKDNFRDGLPLPFFAFAIIPIGIHLVNRL